MDLNLDKKVNKKTKQSYFSSPKKQLLVKKLIMDSNQFSMPSSFYQLRPLNECQQSENHHQSIQQKQSSMKQISYFQKNDNHLIDQVIEDGHPHYHHAFLVNHKYHDQILPEQSEQEDSSPLKRHQPSYRQKHSKFEYKSKIFHQIQQYNTIKVQLKDINNKNISTNKCKKINKKTSMKQLQKIFYNKQQKDQADESLPDQIPLQIKNKDNQRHPPSYNKRNIDNEDFSTMNQFVQLMCYATLIDELITIYDSSPLFIDPLDFNSQDQNSQQQQQKQISIQNSSSIIQIYQNSQAAPNNQNVQVKIQQIQQMNDQKQQKQNKEKKDIRQIDSMINEIKLQQNSYKNKKTKQQMFQSSKTYMNFVDSIEQLKPYVKRMTMQQKQIFLMFKRQLKEIKQIIDYFQKKNKQNSDHICKICGDYFQSGRQLGGHMSRKHPGKALQYGMKKELHKVKALQRNRRLYFKKNKN